MSGKSKAAALKAKCLDCVNWQRAEVTACEAETCPLHPYRPYQDGSQDAEESDKSSMAGDFSDEPEKTA